MPKTLVLFWGWNNSDHSYKPVFDTTPSDWQIKTIDYHQAIPDADVSKLPAKVLKFLDKNGLDKVTLAGHSMGGALATRFAAIHPDRVEHLVLANSAGAATNPNLAVSVVKLLGEHLRSTEKPSTKDIEQFMLGPLHSLRLGIFANSVDLKADASAITIPTTIIWGDADRLFPLTHGRRLHQWIPGSRLHVLNGKGHDWIRTNPEVLWEHISRKPEMN